MILGHSTLPRPWVTPFTALWYLHEYPKAQRPNFLHRSICRALAERGERERQRELYHLETGQFLGMPE